MPNLAGYDFAANVHKFRHKDTRILLDVNSGSIHLIDEDAWRALDLLEECGGDWEQALERLGGQLGPQTAAEVMGELQSLADEGTLFTADTAKETYRPPRTSPIKAMCLHVAHDCNLRCDYCFAGAGDFGGERGLMTVEVGKQAIDFLIEKSGGRQHLEIDFFGGEPLLNLDVVKELTAYARKRGEEAGKIFKLTLTTNGVLLDGDKAEFVNREMESVVLSLDGRKEVNDRIRTYADGSGSYDEIVPNLKRFLEQRGKQKNWEYYVRGTYTHHNLDFAADALHIADLGFHYLSVEPVVGGPQDDYAIKEEDLDTLRREYDKLTDAYLERRDFDFFHFRLELAQGPCLPKRLSGCGAGFEYVAVSPEGDIYPCHQFMGRQGYRMGNVRTGDVDPAITRRFLDAHIYNKPACSGCWARFFCSGGCHANAEAAHGDLRIPYHVGCELEKKRLECAMYIQVKKSGY